jgi:hypothetical protein
MEEAGVLIPDRTFDGTEHDLAPPIAKLPAIPIQLQGFIPLQIRVSFT